MVDILCAPGQSIPRGRVAILLQLLRERQFCIGRAKLLLCDIELAALALVINEIPIIGGAPAALKQEVVCRSRPDSLNQL
jgi:hypothetical protein